MDIAIGNQHRYKWYDCELQRVAYLKGFSECLDNDISLYSPKTTKPLQRKNQDGVWLFTAKLNGVPIAIIWNDFRVSGGSFGKQNVDRILSFMSHLKQQGLPLIVGVNSMGVKISQGRTHFDKAFRLIPAFEEYKRIAKLYTISIGNCFGLGAILFGLGHYRFAIREQAKLNLTGPEVFSLFFGKKINFDELTCIDNQNKRTGLVSEVTLTHQDAFIKIGQLITFETGSLNLIGKETFQDNQSLGLQMGIASLNSQREAYKLLSQFSDGYLRLFRTFDDKLMVFVARIGNKKLGVLINPPGNTDNMIGERTLELYEQALIFFQSLELPILSILDTPGADPRVQANNYRILEKIIDVARLIYSYPYPKMGIGHGRCFGGACVLAIPKIFGGSSSYVLEDTETGIMHPDIITQLLSGSNRLLEEWEQNRAKQTPDMQDLIDEGCVDSIIPSKEIRAVVENGLFQLDQTEKLDETTNVVHKYQPKIFHPQLHEKQGSHSS